MVRVCHKCKTENSENSFWCVNCKTKLKDNIKIEKPKEIIPKHRNFNDIYLKNENTTQKTKKSHDFNFRAHLFKIFVIILILSLMLVTTYVIYDNYFGVGKFGKDYWFEEDKLFTEDGWVFTISKSSICNFKGIVLSTNRYNKNPFSNDPTITFSPIDIFCGLDDIIDNPSDYSYKINMWQDRVVWYSYGGTEESSDYFLSHITNTHIIPHNKEVSEAVILLKKGDRFTMNGYYVNLYGNNEEKSLYGYKWNTDTKPGNQKCEVILLDSITINNVVYGN